MGRLAASVEDAGGVVMVPAFAGLGSPYWDPTRSWWGVLRVDPWIDRWDLARAIVESMAYQTRDVVSAMSAATNTHLKELRVDGGAAQMDLCSTWWARSSAYAFDVLQLGETSNT